MQIKHHRLTEGARINSPNTGGTINPRFVVMHYTAGWDDDSAIQTFKSSASKVSAHLVIGLDGEITQMVPFNKAAWHAGPSKHMGFRGLNKHSVGIEIVNPGFMRKVPNRLRTYSDWAGNYHDFDDDDMIMVPYPKAGSGDFYWKPYTDQQLRALDKIVPLLVEKYDILDIVGHEEIDTRGWKTDPGPLFPMMRYRHLIDRRDKDEVEDFIDEDGVITASFLNIRSGPGTDHDIKQVMKRGMVVNLLEQEGDWYRIATREGEAYAHGNFVRRVS